MNGPLWRLVLVLFGGLVFLQSSASNGKVVYFVFVVCCLAISIFRVYRKIPQIPALRHFEPAIAGCAVMALLVAISLPVSLLLTGPLDWFRAILTYFLLAALPIIGIDAGISNPPRLIRRVVLVVGILAPAAFLADWLTRRGVSALPVGRFLYASIPLCAVMFAYSLGRVAEQKRVLLWTAGAMYAPLFIVLTGTRSGIALVGGAIGAFGIVKARQKFRLPIAAAVIAIPLVVFCAIQLIPIVGPLLVKDPTFYTRRLQSLDYFLSGRVTGDQSYLARQLQTDTAFSVFHDNLLFGQGVGVPQKFVKTFDTPAAPLAFFGLAGVFLVIAFVLGWVVTSVRIYRQIGPSPALTTARVYLLSMLCYLPLSSVLDDKGLSLGIMLIVALLASTAQHPPSPVDMRPLYSRIHARRDPVRQRQQGNSIL